MNEAETTNYDLPLPPEMYRGGFRDSAAVIGAVMDKFGLSRPSTIYYPGSSSDVSLLDVPDAHIIHADSHLDEAKLHGFSTLGAEAHAVDVHEWGPSEAVDLVTFVNPTGIDEGKVLANTELRPGGIVLWYERSGRPQQLQDNQDLRLIGAVTFGEEEGFSIDTEHLDDYFIPRSFDELEADDQQDFVAKVDAFMHQHNYKFSPGNSYATMYTAWQQPKFRFTAEKAGVTEFPYRKEAPCFIYQKAHEEAAG